MNFNALYIFFCIIFVGKGDDRWKRRSKGISESDIGIVNESEGIERDAWAYENSFDIVADNNYNNAPYKYTKQRKLKRGSLKEVKLKRMNRIPVKKISNGLYSVENAMNVSEELTLGLIKSNNSNKNFSTQIVDTIPKWPKFEDLLLSIGVEYDWKSDRWIKIKDKITKISEEHFKFFNKHKVINHKHDFKYRTVRINGSKNRKNVIIAVTAVR